MSASTKALISQIFRLQAIRIRNFHTHGQPVCIHQTSVVNSVMRKKKKKVQIFTPEQLRRKKKFYDTELSKQTRLDRIKKPVDEIEVHPRLQREANSGLRDRDKVALTTAEIEEQDRLPRLWARHKMFESQAEWLTIHRVTDAQQHALARLREESEDLYQQAIQIDEGLLSYTCRGPVETPPIHDFDPVDGDYTDDTNYFDTKKKDDDE